ncbi:DUF2637 domain-containing protein [Mycobacterium sp. M1]|uniref:DUF2637 domain-containing protein n=1 Tax=Mycolicibacter acidiphilus TaxID=2835306 RepID=A0ABS5RL90_9MYCO|nr:DUF2637 domain-containing protein [Mycolicibacter acidiphilus]MBS9535083.1 DUF2637 domain-containing protein [Mycolicibacter acidiphilus]
MAKKTTADAALEAHLEEIDADRAHARRFFWTWLVAATFLTLLGNAGHALLPADLPKQVRLAVALTPPLIALIAIHGVTVLARVGAGTRSSGTAKWTFRAAVAATLILAIDAAVISFNGLNGLALASGLSPRMALLFPLAIDAGIALATLAIYHLRPASAADIRAAREKAQAEREAAEAAKRADWERAVKTRPTSAEVADAKADTAAMRRQASAPTPAPTPPRAAESRAEFAPVSAVEPSAEHLRLAHELVELRATSAEPSAVAMALALEERATKRADITRATGIQKDALRRLIARADEVRDGAEPARESLHAVI